MSAHTDDEITQAFKVLSDVVNGDHGIDTLVHAFADEHPTLQMGFYRALNAGMLLRLREGYQGGGLTPANGNPETAPSDQRIAQDVATFARHAYIPRI